MFILELKCGVVNFYSKFVAFQSPKSKQFVRSDRPLECSTFCSTIFCCWIESTPPRCRCVADTNLNYKSSAKMEIFYHLFVECFSCRQTARAAFNVCQAKMYSWIECHLNTCQNHCFWLSRCASFAVKLHMQLFGFSYSDSFSIQIYLFAWSSKKGPSVHPAARQSFFTSQSAHLSVRLSFGPSMQCREREREKTFLVKRIPIEFAFCLSLFFLLHSNRFRYNAAIFVCLFAQRQMKICVNEQKAKNLL